MRGRKRLEIPLYFFSTVFLPHGAASHDQELVILVSLPSTTMSNTHTQPHSLYGAEPCPPKSMTTQNLKMQTYLEIGSLQMLICCNEAILE